MSTSTRSTRNRALCAAWLDWMRQQGRSDLTVYQYAEKLDSFCGWIGDRPFGDLTVADLEGYIDRPRGRRAHGEKGSASTRAQDVVIFRGLWGWACSHGHLAYNPASDLARPKVRNSNPRAIDPELWSKVWRAELDDAERVFLGLGFFCGLRREEICRLETKHFDADNGRIVHFKRKGDTNDKVTGVLPYLSCVRLFAEKRPELIGVPEDFLLPLASLTGEANPYVMPWGKYAVHALRRRPAALTAPSGMTSPDQLNRRLGGLLKRLGLPPNAFSPHALRHSFVTYSLEMGLPLEVVSRLANHSSVSITMRYFRMTEDPIARFLSKEPLKHLGWR